MDIELLSKIVGLSALLIGQIYASILFVMSFFTFFMYGWDKRAAEQGTDRISEKSLHTLELLGGWPGAIAGQQFFRHKTQKTMFRVITYFIATVHVLVIGAVLWSAWQ